MAVEKISIALDATVADAARRAAGRAGLSLSAWINAAADDAVSIQQGLEAVAEFEREHGAFTPEELAEADRILDDAGIPR